MIFALFLLLALAALAAGSGLWTRLGAHSADERAGAAIPFLIAGLLLALAILLLTGWAISRLVFA